MAKIEQTDPAAALDALARDFAALPDWEGRYRLLLAMGDGLDPIPLDRLTDDARVAGCSSQVWLMTTPLDGGRLAFTGESDARLVRGLIAVLVALLSGRRRGEIAAFDARAAFLRLGLAQQMSAQRSNGLAAMVARLKQEAAPGRRGAPPSPPRLTPSRPPRFHAPGAPPPPC